ncbi:tetratricopeptide repeat protein [Marinobacter orientalis]|uniref:Tetratricopeptide repeat protein n=1 Tax=Marinobacter orientalis TaxID=1928859 RepID=A0A7Y0RBS7_9GAMM|nr:tetratricopeptide repeat protein [Marinobacter orientalis]NMT63337.1 tetratricopeptide repeat protein [Marinobacter orientalis]TGX51981.1 tetratricopeptide repeat protein [Marinobacter orientalis]
MRPSGSAILFVALMILAPALVAEEPGVRADFESGVSAFDEGDLSTARAHFERARDAGLNTPSLLYNLGVVYFRLGQYESAEAVFLELLGTRHAPLARYNLGLVMQEKGQDDAAHQWFEQAAGPDSPEKVRALALRQLDRTDPDRSGDTSGSGYLLAAGGYDDNIAGAPDDASSNQAGAFADLLAVGNLRIGSGDFGLHGIAYTRQYPGDTEFDNSFLSTGASWLKDVGAGELTSTLSLAGSWFGGDALEREVRLEAEYRPDQCLFASIWSGIECSASGSVSTIDGGSDFAAYDGEMLRLGVSAWKSLESWLFRGGYELEVNDRKDLASREEFFSVSPLRNLVSAEARYYASGRLSLGARGDIRHSRYRDDHRLVSGTDVVTRRRTDSRLRGVLLAEYRLTGPWLVLAEYSIVHNDSTIDRYDYNRREVMIGIERAF